MEDSIFKRYFEICASSSRVQCGEMEDARLKAGELPFRKLLRATMPGLEMERVPSAKGLKKEFGSVA